jgi:hypothetical protein
MWPFRRRKCSGGIQTIRNKTAVTQTIGQAVIRSGATSKVDVSPGTLGARLIEIDMHEVVTGPCPVSAVFHRKRGLLVPMPEQIYRCPLCSFSTTNVGESVKHLSLSHIPEILGSR